MRGRMVTCWHPESPGVRVVVWRPWWRRKARRFASLTETIRYGRSLDALATGEVNPYLRDPEPEPSTDGSGE